MWVVKLGGSLMKNNQLEAWLSFLKQYSGQLVLLPGGGEFADHIRNLQQEHGFDDIFAHKMAVLAMEQLGYYCKSLLPDLVICHSLEETKKKLTEGKLVCFFPSEFLLTKHDLPMNWGFTSDSISAVLAKALQAEVLILVKSMPEIDSSLSLKALSEAGIVDDYFAEFCRGESFEVHCLAANDFLRIQQLLIE